MNGKVSQNTDTSQATRENNDEFICNARRLRVNPTTGEVVSSLPWASEREVDAAIALAAAGLSPVASDAACRPRRCPAPHRAALRARGEEVAQMITLEMGKPIAQARGEVAKSANLCDWYAEHGPAMLATEATPGGK